jgi:hypothetical protein
LKEKRQSDRCYLSSGGSRLLTLRSGAKHSRRLAEEVEG